MPSSGRAAERPSGRALAVAQHRVREKTFVAGLDLSVPRFAPVRTEAELQAAMSAVGGPAVLKTASFGYDGRGPHRRVRLRERHVHRHHEDEDARTAQAYPLRARSAPAGGRSPGESGSGVPGGARTEAGSGGVDKQSMDKVEARQLLSTQLDAWRRRSYAELTAEVGRREYFHTTGRSGASYEGVIEILWEHGPIRAVRIVASIDDGGWETFVPVMEDLVIAPDAGGRET